MRNKDKSTNYQAKEEDLSAVRDFEAVCEYIQANRPTLTKGGALSLKACYEINGLLSHPKKDAKPTDRMGLYASVSLYFTALSAPGLFEPVREKNNKRVLVATDKYEVFRSLNTFTKYLYILLAWMRCTNTDDLYERENILGRRSVRALDIILVGIGKQSSSDWLMREDTRVYNYIKKPLQLLLDQPSEILAHLRDMNILEYNDDDVFEKDRYGMSGLTKLRVTPLGEALGAAFNTRRFSWVNDLEEPMVGYVSDDDDDKLYDEDYLNNQPGTLGFYTPFLSCFPKDSIDDVALDQLLFPPAKPIPENIVYEFKVQLGKECYRIIQCAGRHNFQDLHSAIQCAFNFDDDHLYSFYLDGKLYSKYRIDSPYSDNEPFADEVLIGAVGLYEKQGLLYLFDFGQSWLFKVKVVAIKMAEYPLRSPAIVKSVGEAPEQYPSWDDDDF